MVTFMDERYIFQNLGLFVGVGLFFMTGAAIHAFIAVVMIGWMKGRTMTAVDKIITSLSIARLSFQLACLINMFLEICYQDGFLFSIVKRCADFTELLSNTCCICLFTLLTFVFCLKISNYRNAYFQHLKFVLVQRTIHLISAVVVVSILQTVVFMWSAELIHRNSTDDYVIDYYDRKVALQYVYFYTSGNAAPFLIQLTSSFLAIYSLYVHLRRMRSRTSITTLVDPYYGVIRAIIFCSLNFALEVILTLTFVYHYETLGTIFSYVTWNIFPIIHSLYIIHSTAKLRNVFSQILQNGRNCMVKGGHSEPN